MKVKFPSEDGYIALNVSVGELVDRHVGRNVGKSVSPKTACSQNINRTLKAYNISGTILDWIESFLKDLTQQVIVNGCRSNVRRVTSGVPQGSVLGPVLFLVYVNDMPNEIHNIIKLFADDTKLYSTQNSETPLQTDLNTVAGWTKKWLMTLNTQKCKHMHIGRSEQHNKLVLKDQLDQDIQLIPAENEKDLGVTFDKDLKFGVHIQRSVNKANKTLGIIFRTYTYMDILKCSKPYTKL